LAEAGSNAFTMSPTKWVDLTAAVGILTKNGAGGSTYAQRDIAFKFANWVSVEFELYLVMEFQRLKAKEQGRLAGQPNVSSRKSTTASIPMPSSVI